MKQNLVLRFKRQKTPFYAKAINHENYGGPNNHLGQSNYPGRMGKMGPCLQASRRRYEDQLLRTWYGTKQKKAKRQLWLEPSHSAFLLKYGHAFLITETKDQLHPSGLPISYV